MAKELGRVLRNARTWPVSAQIQLLKAAQAIEEHVNTRFLLDDIEEDQRQSMLYSDVPLADSREMAQQSHKK